MEISSSILFTCAGTTDPVRGGRDGGILHIMRHYRPQKIFLFLSNEMEMIAQKDHRFEEMVRFAHENWTDYNPQIESYSSKLDEVADLDTVYDPLLAFFQQVTQSNPQSKILINLSSGTPQMKTILAQLALDLRYNVVGVQVSIPERKAGTTPRTNEKGYAVSDELFFNDDEVSDAPNRCTEPKMFTLRRSEQKARMLGLLDRRDYRALETFGQNLPPELSKLIVHLAARSDLQKEATKLARACELPFDLYPARKKSDGEYNQLSEYYLLLRNLEKTQRYTEFVLRLNPFLIRLMVRLLDQQLRQRLSFSLADIVEHRHDDRIRLDPKAMRVKMPSQMRCLEQLAGSKIQHGKDISVFICTRLLRALGGLPDTAQNLLDACDNLNEKQRNSAAHQLHTVTKEQIRDYCVDNNGKQYDVETLVKALGELLSYAYPDVCDTKLFTVYDRCANYIREKL